MELNIKHDLEMSATPSCSIVLYHASCVINTTVRPITSQLEFIKINYDPTQRCRCCSCTVSIHLYQFVLLFHYFCATLRERAAPQRNNMNWLHPARVLWPTCSCHDDSPGCFYFAMFAPLSLPSAASHFPRAHFWGTFQASTCPLDALGLSCQSQSPDSKSSPPASHFLISSSAHKRGVLRSEIDGEGACLFNLG